MYPVKIPASVGERYDLSLQYARDARLPPGAPQPLPTKYWPKENVELLERFHAWLMEGGACEYSTNIIYLPIAGHALGLNIKSHGQIDLETDLNRALEYIHAKGAGPDWQKACRNGLEKFRRFLRLERGLGDVSKVKTFDLTGNTQGLPAWLVSELERFQRLQQRNWRTARIERNLHGFWNRHLHAWRFLCEECHVIQLSDLKRQHLLDYMDKRLNEGHSVTGVNTDMRCLRAFLFFLQEEGYTIPQSLLRIPGLKPPDPLPKYLTDEQIRLLRDDFENRVAQARLTNHRRDALLDRAIFHLLWQCGLRAGEVEELMLEDLDLENRKIDIRDGKGRKDRSVYVAEAACHALKEYLAARGSGFGNHVFLYRNTFLKKDLIHARIKYAGNRVGVKVYPHRLRHTCATQLLNAGCRITSIQRFLGHKKISTTMIYARVLDPTLAEDYFAAMRRIEQRLEIVPNTKEEPEKEAEIVKVPPNDQVFVWIERLALPELCQQERLDVAEKLKQALSLSYVSQLSPPLAV
jgi:site-specific recombinase XerD